MRFVDEAVITVRSGKGGAGSVSFRREKFVPLGGPDGGDGGKGGDMVFRASDNLLTLYDLRLKRIYGAKNGQGGMGRQRYGAAGPDLVVEVPTGTQIYELAEDGTETLAVDLVHDGQTWIACKGGRGGKGNMHFSSSTMRAPRFAQPGEPGQEKKLRLELKVLADIGIIGLPNAGKSTLIAAVSHAKPKIAPYPFTTLSPNLGVIEDAFGRRIVMADIPGLIEGAHQGLGLGHQFLKHVERTKALVHLMSVEDVNLEDPLAGFAVVDEELARFDPKLAERPQIRVLNKIDLLDADTLAALRAALPPTAFLVSAKVRTGLDDLLSAMSGMVYPEGEEGEG
ncbi:MAG: GTPase ObgE [Desulfovibrionaceae bacterium]|nr:GTPase ObgE [Desulfovibrionaceae bacterium]